ncbi:MAG: hypothetical protein CBARDCOR_4716, partial [uncultured Caballeronia sp.]
FQVFVEPEHGILPNIWTTVLSSSMVSLHRDRAPRHSTAVRAELCEIVEVDRPLPEVRAAFGQIEVLINNAGGLVRH